MKIVYCLIVFSLLVGCSGPKKQVDRDQLDAERAANTQRFLEGTLSVPTSVAYEEGLYGGRYRMILDPAPKTLNMANPSDATTSNILTLLYPYLLGYDPNLRSWSDDIASYEIVDDKNKFLSGKNYDSVQRKIINSIPSDGLGIVYTIRDDAVWYLPESGETRPVVAEDAIFWYNEIVGDPRFQNIGYAGNFMQMPDGSMSKIEGYVLDEKSFIFIFPQVVENPMLSTNMNFAPAFIYKAAKSGFTQEQIAANEDIKAVKALFGIGSDTKQLPSAGPFYIEEYISNRRMTLKRNPYFYQKDEWGNALPYLDEIDIRFMSSEDAIIDEFEKGKIFTVGVPPHRFDYFLDLQEGYPDKYVIYSGGAAMNSPFISFNQNPVNKDEPFYHWFTKKQFRQAMSCIFNRERVVDTIYRGLGEPAKDFFAPANYMYNPDIQLEYLYDLSRAVELLASIGITQGKDGLMYDKNGNQVKFDLAYGEGNEMVTNMLNIFVDEAKKVGITIVLRPVDFYTLIDSLTSTYKWEACLLSFGGSNFWPISGSNIWQSSGNLHLWYPLQESPATDWEKRIDYLYHKGSKTLDKDKAKVIWDEYQQIILEELPLFYLVYPGRFRIFNTKVGNVRFDAFNEGEWFFSEVKYLYLKDAKGEK
ncbi:MAG: hypothetical protein JXR63_09675 [Spirochaetales bacterium]|nr:hypothetical protein [Spirochaetales bacterium]